MWIAFLIGLALIVYGLLSSKSTSSSSLHKNILDCQSMTDVVSSIGYGRLFPYYIGMPVEKVRRILISENRDITEFEDSLKFAQMISFAMSVELPKPNYAGIEEVSLRIKNDVVSGFTIDLVSELEKHQAYQELSRKFGRPILNDRMFTIWREKYMVITLNNESNSIYIINERMQ